MNAFSFSARPSPNECDAQGDVTQSSRMTGRKASGVDRFVDRVTRANSAISAIGGTTPWYQCR